MTIRIDIPDSAAQTLRVAFGDDLDRAAFEALLIEGYRSGKLSIGAVAGLLGFDNRWDAERWLGDRAVRWNYSLADLEADRATLAGLFGETVQ